MNFTFKLYIQDENSKWVDFSDKLNLDNKGNLQLIGAIQKQLSGKSVKDSFSTNTITIKMDNSNFFWDNTDKWESITTTDNNTALFNTSKNNYEIDIINSWVKLGCFSDDTYYSLGIYKINSMTTNLMNVTSTIKLIDISTYLKNKKAELIRNGRFWYRNKPITFLLEKLLDEADQGDLFETDLPRRIFMESYKKIRVFSQLGTPPEEIVENVYNPLFYFPYSDEHSNEFRNENLVGVFEV